MYNATKYVKQLFQCFEKYKQYPFELIFVEDCSSDNTYSELMKYAETSELNVKVLRNKENSGAGLTRNNGIAVATGEYITFLDSDDCFTDDYFDTIIPLLDNGYDVIAHDAKVVYEDGRQKHFSMFFAEMPAGKIETKEALVFIKGCTWGKIYKRALIIDNSVEFLNLKRNEDMPFTKIATSLADNIIYVKKELYCYVQNAGSLMHNPSLLTSTNAQKSFMHIKSRISEKFFEEVEAMFLIEYLYATVLTNARTMKRRELLSYVMESEAIYPNCYENRYIKEYSIIHRTILKIIQHKYYFLIKLILKAKG